MGKANGLGKDRKEMDKTIIGNEGRIKNSSELLINQKSSLYKLPPVNHLRFIFLVRSVSELLRTSQNANISLPQKLPPQNSVA